MEVARLEAVYTASTSDFDRKTANVDARLKQTAKTAGQTERSVTSSFQKTGRSDLSLAQQMRATESLQRQRSAALIAQWREQERAAKRLADTQIREAKRAADGQLREAKRWAGIGGAQRVGVSGALAGGAFAGGVAGGVTALLGISVVGQVRQGVAAWFDYASSLEATRIAFTTMLGSAREADNHLKDLQRFALKTPFEFRELVAASQRMQALGFSAQEVVPLLNDVGNAVAAAGGGSERLDRVVLALSQMQSKGKVATQEMNQLAEAGLPGWKILEDQLGKSRAELVKLVEDGKISSKVFLDAFQTFSRNNFGSLMEQQSKTAIGALSNLKDAIFQISERALAPLFKEIRDGLLSVSNNLLANQSAWEQWGTAAVNRILAVKTTLWSVIDLIVAVDQRLAQMSGLDKVSQEMKRQADQSSDDLNLTLMSWALFATTVKDAITGGPPPSAPTAEQGGMGRIRMDAQGRLIKDRVKSTDLTDAGGGRRKKQQDILEGLKSTLVSLNSEWRKWDVALLDSANASALAAQKQTLLENVMSSLSSKTKLAISSTRDIDEALNKAVASLPQKSQASARALIQESLAQFKLNEERRIAGEVNKEAERLTQGWRLEIDNSRLGADEFTKAIQGLEAVYAQYGLQVDSATRKELEHLAAQQRLLKATRERVVILNQLRQRVAGGDILKDLGEGSFVFRGESTRDRIATVGETVLREREQMRLQEMREIAEDLGSIFGDAFDSIRSGWRNLWQDMADIAQNISRQLVQELFTGLFSRAFNVPFQSQSGGIVGGIINRIFTSGSQPALTNLGGGSSFTSGGTGLTRPRIAGARAMGGPVEAGQIYRINERGTEYFRPNIGGQVIPLGQQTQERSEPLRLAIVDDLRQAREWRANQIMRARKQSRKIGKLIPGY